MDAQIIQKEKDSGDLIAKNRLLKITEKQPIFENR
jgi:hypothetical protein